MNTVNEYQLFTWMSQSMDELLGEAQEAEYTSRALSVTRGRFNVKPDFFPFWSALQERPYLHWLWQGSEYWLFENGVLLERRSYRGNAELIPEDVAGDVVNAILGRCSDELKSIVNTRKFAATLMKGGVTTQSAFIEWFMDNYEKSGEVI